MVSRATAITGDPSSVGMRLLRKHLESGYSVKRQLERYSGKMREDIASAYGDAALARGEYKTAMMAYEISKNPEKFMVLASTLFEKAETLAESGKMAAEAMMQARKTMPETVAGHGKILEGEFYSKSLGKNMRYNVYVPPGYESSKERYPVIYLFHGYSGSHSDWPSLGKIQETADSLISKGLMKNTMIVMPDTENGTMLKEREIPAAAKLSKLFLKLGNWDEYVTKDLIPRIDREYRTIADKSGRATDGFCLGATNSVSVAFRHPEMFSSVAGHQGVYFKTETPKNSGNFNVYIDASRFDPLFLESLRFSRQMRKSGMKHSFATYAGRLGMFRKEFWRDLKDKAGIISGSRSKADDFMRENAAHILTGFSSHNWYEIRERVKDSLMFHSMNFENAAKKKD